MDHLNQTIAQVVLHDTQEKVDPVPIQPPTKESQKATKIKEMLEKQVNPSKYPAPVLVDKWMNEAGRNWDIFYKRNTTNFFKDRHWTEREFSQELCDGKKTILEVGSGVGNFVFPLLDHRPDYFINCCDFSPRAIDFIKSNPKYDSNRMNAFVCDLTTTDLVDQIEKESIDVVSSIFCLSAIPPQKMETALGNIAAVLKKGGSFIFRDYGLYDEAQLRFKPENVLPDSTQKFYVRHDLTFTYFFTPEEMVNLCQKVGLKSLECEYVHKQVVNRKQALSMDRIFVQGRFVKE